MKIYDLDSEIVIDSIPFIFDPIQKIFLTTLVHIETPSLPKIFSKIYTSKELKAQFTLFLNNRGIEIEDDNFHVWKPFEPEIITLSNGTIYEVLPCCPQDITTNMLLVFRQGSVITHIYVGLCSELRSTLLNKTLISWLRGNRVQTAMYIPYNNASKRCIDCEFRKAIAEIERKVNADNTAKLLIQLPFFGSESFLNKVASEFRGYVAVCGLLRKLYITLPTAEAQYFTEDINMARIIIFGGDITDYLSSNQERGNGIITNKSTIKWSPLPTPIELNLLSDLVRPKKVYGIKFKNMFAALEQPVQISILGCGSRKECTPKFIQRQGVTGEQCCYENFHKITQQVLENIKGILKNSSKRQDFNEEANTQEDLPEEQLKTAPHLEKNQAPISVQYESKVVKERGECSKPSVESLSEIQQRQNSEAGKITNDQTSSPPVNMQRKSLDQLPECSNFSTNQSKNVIQEKSRQDRIRKRTTCPPINTLVYRKGKKGICFIDEETSSSD